MRQKSSLKGWDFYGDHSDGYQDHWYFIDGEYPVLSWQADIAGLRVVRGMVGTDVHTATALLRQDDLVRGDRTFDYSRDHEYGIVIRTPSNYARSWEVVGLVVSLGAYDWSLNTGNGSQEKPYFCDAGRGRFGGDKRRPY